MSTLRVLPVRRAMIGAGVLSLASMTLCTWMLGSTFGRRGDDGHGALVSSLQLVAALETQRVQTALEQRQQEMDAALSSLLGGITEYAPRKAPVAAANK